jgi:hypothetical protein
MRAEGGANSRDHLNAREAAMETQHTGGLRNSVEMVDVVVLGQVSSCGRPQGRSGGRIWAQTSATCRLALGLILFRFVLNCGGPRLKPANSKTGFWSSYEQSRRGRHSLPTASLSWRRAGGSWHKRPTGSQLSSALGTNACFPHPAALGCRARPALERHGRDGRTGSSFKSLPLCKAGGFKASHTKLL